MLSRYDNRNGFLKLPQIFITSPDQFVPLFLAYENPFTEYLSWSGRYKLNWHLPSTLKFTKEDFKKELLNMFNLSYPDSYAIPVLTSKIMDNSSGSDNNDLAMGTFAGVGTAPSSYQGQSYYVLPGLVFECLSTSPNPYSLLKAPEYPEPGTMLCYSNFLRLFNPTLIMLVKAKHIPAIRAAQHLKVPFKLPLNGAKVLTYNNHRSLLVSRITKVLLDPIISNQGLIHEYHESQELRKYVIGEKLPVLENMTNILDKAIELQTEICNS